ncbi:hypothetical protein HER39_17700, partial [Arthrobacter deserti]|nr:hypothetical protein [Arthrobacter deserti]
YLPAGTRTRATRLTDVLEATRDVETVLNLFQGLELVVTLGTFARDGWELLRARSSQIRSLDWQPVPHPSATNLNTRPEHRAQILHVMTKAAQRVR